VLVLRGRARQVAALIGAAAAAGALASLVAAFGDAQDAALEAVMAQGATGDVFVTTMTAWYWVTGLAVTVCLATLVVAVRKARVWPAMGSRYDAPAARSATPATDQDLWRALDEGHDPTA
jgi:hypothetical protein